MGDQLRAPGCFGAATVFSHDSEVCRACAHFDACAASSLETLKAIQGIVNVEDILKRHERAKRTARVVIAKRDADAAQSAPPGNAQPPMIKKAERKTEVAKVKIGITPDEQAVIATLGVKPQAVAVRLCEAGVFKIIAASLRGGKNLLEGVKTGQWLSVATQAVLDGGVTRAELKESYMTKLGWSDGTAASYVTITFQLLIGFKLAQEVNERLVLIPRTSA